MSNGLVAEGRRGGVLLRVDGALVFVSVGLAVKLVPLPQIARVPGAPPDLLGIALQDGEIVPALAIGSARESMLVCTYLGERVGLVGGEVVATGMFEVGADDAVMHGSERAEPLDLGSLYARVHAGGWGGRWAG
jgi:hypothetical protein